jgi:hypothetical protein
MGRIILGVLAAIVLVILLGAIVHAIIFGFWIALIFLVVFGLLRIVRWSGGRRSGQRYR